MKNETTTKQRGLKKRTKSKHKKSGMLKSVKLTTCNFANVDEWGDMHACNVRSKQAFYRCSGCLKGTTTVKRIPVREKRKELEKKKKVRNCRSSQLVVAVAAAAAAVCCRRGITG